jgi:hypothetical protein
MGCFGSRSSTFYTIPERFKSIADVQRELTAQGLESSNLILGIDYTKSNFYTVSYYYYHYFFSRGKNHLVVKVFMIVL